MYGAIEKHRRRELDDDYRDTVAVVSAKLLKGNRWQTVDWPADYADDKNLTGQLDCFDYIKHILPDDSANGTYVTILVG